jgi:hypothetical protein
MVPDDLSCGSASAIAIVAQRRRVSRMGAPPGDPVTGYTSASAFLSLRPLPARALTKASASEGFNGQTSRRYECVRVLGALSSARRPTRAGLCAARDESAERGGDRAARSRRGESPAIRAGDGVRLRTSRIAGDTVSAARSPPQSQPKAASSHRYRHEMIASP